MKYRMQNTECRPVDVVTPERRVGTRHAKCSMQNSECDMQNAACGMRNAECGMQNVAGRTRHAEFGM